MDLSENGSIECSENYINKLASFSHPLPLTGEKGINRLAFTPCETDVLNWAKKELEKFEYYCEFDSFLNLHAYDQRVNESRILVGTHLDTVLNGGKYDGAVGFVTFLIALRQIKEKNKQFKFPVDFVIFRAEESTIFNEALLGSKVSTGLYNLDELMDKIFERPEGIDTAYEKLYEHNHSLKLLDGWSPIDLILANSNGNVKLSEIKKGCWFFKDKDGRPIRDYKAYFEIHIEQGKYLELNNIEIGVVSSIRAPVRYKVELTGKRDHSGATPMGKEYRQDVLCAASQCILKIESICEHEAKNNNVDIVGTVGSINIPAGMGINIIQGKCSFTIDLRSNNSQERSRIFASIQDNLESICNERNIRIEFIKTEESEPVSLEANAPNNFFSKIEKIINNLGLSYEEMPSGAGHDTMRMSQVGIPSCLLFIPCKNGISHSPDEYAKPEDIFKASKVLENILLDGLDG